MPLDVHAVPASLHVPPTPPQHGWPLPPQAHVPDAHARLAPHDGLPAQHAWPLPPQATQLPELLQTAPALQLDPLQQA